MMDGKQLKPGTVTQAKLGLVDPVGALDAVTKQFLQAYVDGQLWNQDWKASVKVGVGTNVTLTAPGAALDGVTVSAGDRFLAFGQTTGSENGIYVWNGAAVAATRATDFDNNSEVTDGAMVPIGQGTLAGKVKELTTNDPIVVGTTALVFADFIPASSSAVPTTSNKFMTASVTTADGDVASATGLAASPVNSGYVGVNINGDTPEIGNAVKTKDCYFSGDSGATARAFGAIVSGDKLYWNGSIAGYQLAATDKISFFYSV